MTLRRRSLLDNTKFNAMSLAIISAASLTALPLHAQMTAPATAASAAPDIAKYTEAFDRADKNTDGRLSREEAENMPAVAQRFDQIDKNKDGFISKAEYMDALKP